MGSSGERCGIDRIVAHATHRWRGGVLGGSLLAALAGAVLLALTAPPAEPGPEPPESFDAGACDAVWPDTECLAALPRSLHKLPSVDGYALARAFVRLDRTLEWMDQPSLVGESARARVFREAWADQPPPARGAGTAVRQLERIARRNHPVLPEQDAPGRPLRSIVEDAVLQAFAVRSLPAAEPEPLPDWARWDAGRETLADAEGYVALRREGLELLWRKHAEEVRRRHAAWSSARAGLEAHQRWLWALRLGAGTAFAAFAALGALGLAMVPVPVVLTIHQVRIGARHAALEDVTASAWTEDPPGVLLRDGGRLTLPRGCALTPHDREVLDLFTAEQLVARGELREADPTSLARVRALVERIG